jgi:gluconokinase
MPPVTIDKAEAPLALAIDVGSSSVRTGLYDRLGRRVHELGARLAYEMRTTADGGVEVDAGALVELVERAVDVVLAGAGPLADRVACVGVASFWHSLVGVSAEGEPVTPVLTWADTRARSAADDLRRELDEPAVHARTGAVLHASYLPAKLRWLAGAHAAAFERAARWMSFAELLYLRLFGRPACSVSMASGTGLFDQSACRWDEALAAAVGVSVDQLSEVSDDPCSALTPVYAARWPALARAAWRPALGDGACANVGSGCATPSRIALTLGTSGAMRVVLAGDAVAPPRGLWAYRLDARRPVVGGALSEGGGAFAWLVRLLGLEAGEALEAAVAAAEPDAHGLTVLPFVAGERSPGWALDARAAVTGLTLDTTPVDVVRAALESVACRFGLVAELLAAFAAPGAEVVGSGAALLRSRAWAQIMADVLGRPVVLSAEEEASSRGAALMALEAAGAIDDLSSVPSERGRVFEPDAGRHERYRRALDRQRALYDTLVAGN